MKLIVLVALGFGGYLLLRKSSVVSAPPSKPTPGKPTPSSTGTTIQTIKLPTMPIAPDNNSPSLSDTESKSLEADSNDLLLGWAMVTNHKAFAQAIANKLAGAGDIRAAVVTARIANWNSFKLPATETTIAANPLNYTYQQIAEAALASESPEFKQWAAAFLESEGQADSASIIRGQIAAL